MLSPRQEAILKVIVNEYISLGVPVASEVIARNYGLRVSPATIRNEMAILEEEGYILRPHPSAGAVPSHKGYRFFVAALAEPRPLAPAEEQLVAHKFHQVQREMEEWLQLSASLLSSLTQYAAVVTQPHPVEGHFRHLDLIILHRFLVLLILVWQEAWLSRRLLPLEQPAPQQELARAASRLNRAYSGMTAPQISTLTLPLSPVEEAISGAVVEMMRRADQSPEEPHFYGWGHFFQEPEFQQGGEAREALAALEGKRLGFAPLAPGARVRVVIGEENPEAACHPLSWVVGGYGIPNTVGGIVGVVGPTRMRYERAMAAVKHISLRLSQLMSEMYYEGD